MNCIRFLCIFSLFIITIVKKYKLFGCREIMKSVIKILNCKFFTNNDPNHKICYWGTIQEYRNILKIHTAERLFLLSFYSSKVRISWFLLLPWILETKWRFRISLWILGCVEELQSLGFFLTNMNPPWISWS